MHADIQRYSRQILFQGIGEAGQRRIMAGRVLVCGCGALGSALADGLARAGVGFLRIVDRDFVELSNLQRQVLFDEDDVANQLPKAVAAAQKLTRINRTIQVQPIVADIDHANILGLVQDVDLIVDGMDNFETRFLINDAALHTQTPWVYGGCVGSVGQTLTVLPGESACLRCLIDSAPDAGALETCETAGVLGPIVHWVAALQVVAALKLLAGRRDLIEPVLTVVDVWDGSLRKLNVAGLRERANCPACVGGERGWLSGEKGSRTTVLCGRNAVQVTPPEKTTLDLPELAGRLAGAGDVAVNRFLVRLTLSTGGCCLTVFADGRAIIQGTDDPGTARGLYARYVGS